MGIKVRDPNYDPVIVAAKRSAVSVSDEGIQQDVSLEEGDIERKRAGKLMDRADVGREEQLARGLA